MKFVALLPESTESMAGRVVVVGLGPMTPLERLGYGGTPSWVGAYLDNPGGLTGTGWKAMTREEGLYRHMWRGQMPGTLELPDTLLPDYYQSYAATYIERDVRRQGGVAELSEFSRLVGLAAALTAQEINASQFGREIGVSPRTARLWLNILSACYQWRELPAYHGNAVKRVSGKPKGYFGDTGLACWLQRISAPDALAANPLSGALFETMVVNSLLSEASLFAAPPMALAQHRRCRGGPCPGTRRRPLSGGDEMQDRTVRPRSAGVRAFRDTYSSQVRHAVIVYAGTEVMRVAPDITVVPWLMAKG